MLPLKIAGILQHGYDAGCVQGAFALWALGSRDGRIQISFSEMMFWQKKFV